MFAGGCAPAVDPGEASSALGERVVLGLHDGAINHCDNFESWWGADNAPIFGQAGYPSYARTAEELGDAAWWQPLAVNTVRVSVPWDIALPWSASDSALVTAHDPPGLWRQYHLAALKNEQTCFDWWLHAALEAHQTVNIAFKPDYDYRDSETNHILAPEIDAYRAAIAAFVDEYADCAAGGGNGACVPRSSLGGGPGPSTVAEVHIITPWGEPDYGNSHYPIASTDRTPGCSAGCEGNDLPSGKITRAKEVFFLAHGSSGMDPNRGRLDDPNCGDLRDDDCGPVLAAQMWMAVYHACPSCVLTSGPTAGQATSGVVAGDFSGGGGLNRGDVAGAGSQSYLQTYSQHLDDCDGCAGVRPATWALHPYPDTSNEEWCLKNTGHDFNPAAANGSNSVTERFLNALDGVGYHEHTYVWLDEVSVFANDNYAHTSTTPPVATSGKSCGVNHAADKPSYAPDVEAGAFRWLYRTLTNATGTTHRGHEPVVERIYYFRSFDGADPDGDNITPGAATANQQALYEAMIHR